MIGGDSCALRRWRPLPSAQMTTAYPDHIRFWVWGFAVYHLFPADNSIGSDRAMWRGSRRPGVIRGVQVICTGQPRHCGLRKQRLFGATDFPLVESGKKTFWFPAVECPKARAHVCVVTGTQEATCSTRSEQASRAPKCNACGHANTDLWGADQSFIILALRSFVECVPHGCVSQCARTRVPVAVWVAWDIMLSNTGPGNSRLCDVCGCARASDRTFAAGVRRILHGF